MNEHLVSNKNEVLSLEYLEKTRDSFISRINELEDNKESEVRNLCVLVGNLDKVNNLLYK